MHCYVDKYLPHYMALPSLVVNVNIVAGDRKYAKVYFFILSVAIYASQLQFTALISNLNLK